MRKQTFTAFVALVAVCLAAGPLHAADSVAELDFAYVISSTTSTDSAYTAAFGAMSIVGRLNTVIRYNGIFNANAKYANVKFYQPLIVLDPTVTACAQKAVTAAATSVILGGLSSDRNAQLVLKITGDVRLNEGNGGYDGQQDLTIIEVRTLKSLACEVQFNYPSFD
jgi:hypothetical protein